MSSASSIILKNNENVTFVSNPSITYFKSVYRKHTKFSIDYKEEFPDDGNNSFNLDTTAEIKIPFHYSADLLCDISLKVRFESRDDAGYSFSPPDDIALHLIDNITFNLQGQLNDFDKLDKEYINFNAMLNNPKSLDSTYTLHNGKLTCNNGNNFQNMALCGGINASGNLGNIKSMDAIIPLPFAFSKSIGTAIPLCAFNQARTTPQIVITHVAPSHIDFGNVQTKADITGSFIYSAISKYIFLSNEEISRFKTTRSEYLYERVNSLQTEEAMDGAINISRLNNKHPIKQIFIHVTSGLLSNALEYNIRINHAPMFSENFHHEFFSKVEILNKFKGCIYSSGSQTGQTIINNKLGIIDFSLKNTEGPSGCISPSNNAIILDIKRHVGTSFNITIYTVCYYLLRISDGELSYVFD